MAKDFGFNLIDPIVGQKAVENYLIKEMQEAAEWRQSGSHLYYVSKGLKRAQKIITGHYDSFTQNVIEKVDGVRSKLLRPYDSEDCYGIKYAIPNTPQNKALLHRLIDKKSHKRNDCIVILRKFFKLMACTDSLSDMELNKIIFSLYTIFLTI